ncbi:MAG: hypothetical protein PHV16_03600 [Candidatus Nanoarchaeia archaeon]|nr:hypothetical protein [Candidatus Nanoarchaeia archaeon]
MNPEKEIVNLWLNKNGFFTINDINAGKNKVIDIIAVKHSEGKLEKIQHVEVSCSISSGFAEKELNEYAKKFQDKTVSKKVKQVIKEFVGKEENYEKVLITSGKGFNTGEIKTKNFDEILFDVIDDLDKQNYRNTTIRTLQLVKYLVLSNPKSIAGLVEKEKGNKIMGQATREIFIKKLLKQDDIKRILEKQSNENEIIEIIKNSSLKNPERLAKALENHILTSKTRKRFLKSLFEQKEISKAGKQLFMMKNQKPLQYYLRKRKTKA